ncbi:hypothetical protein Q31b_35990 [Novipirellula aureliae]|uniref:DUF790 family protein n=1 Tax=Novipirellula aureliae TaxID=2527966 RepID=A0A5C6DVE0_9BACT|nr:DUF790 family protein [Novipirellula aureliae]TWU40254.1 hypothetical protein Q31b_35990 [Novipirellula aureliae]
MLTNEQSILHFDFHSQVVKPDRLVRTSHAHYLELSRRLIHVYQSSVGEPRKVLHRRVQQILQPIEDCPTRRIAAFCKLLDDESVYAKDKAGAAAKLRSRVFGLAAKRHPLVQSADQLFDHCESIVKAEIAAEFGRPWDEIAGQLFNDVIEFHPLKTPPLDLQPSDLLSRYNVAQTQTALYGAVSMTVWAKQDFKNILRYAKLARLMHSIRRQDDTYVFRFNGPASVVRSTKRYGVNFARFLPSLLAADDWRMQATVVGPMKRRFALQLSSHDGLKGRIEDADFDSRIEEMFFTEWHGKERCGWELTRESAILHQAQTVFMPDFTLRHPQHGEVLLEIVGFWTPEYLRKKAATLERFRRSGRILLAIAESVNESIPDLGIERIVYKSKLLPKTVLAALNEMV